MGFFWEGLPPYVMPWASSRLGTSAIAVETGTFRGDSALMLSRHFGQCYTIERSEKLARLAQERFAENPGVKVFHGSSRDLLAEVLPAPPTPCFLWLDAHGVYEHTGPDQEENPLLHELQTTFTRRKGGATIIAIDDARGMGTQPMWPSTGTICSLLDGAGYSVVSFDDVILATQMAEDPNFYELYQASRMVQVGSVFQVWEQVVQRVRRRQRLDRMLGRWTRK